MALSHDVAAIFGMAVGRLSGAIREILVVALLGATYLADISVLLWTLPEILVFFCTANGVNSALSRRLTGASDAQARITIVSTMCICSVLVGIFAVISTMQLPLLMLVIAPGIDLNVLGGDMRSWFAVVLLSAPLVVVASVISAALNSQQRFVHQGFGTAIANIGFVSGILIGWLSGYVVESVSLCVLLGLVLRVYWLGFQARVNSIKLGCRIKIQALSYDLLPAIFGASLSFLIFVIAPVAVRSWSTTLGEGYLVVTALCIKLVQLPLMVVLNSFALVSLQKLSVAYLEDPLRGAELFKARARNILGVSTFISLVLFLGAPYFGSLLSVFVALSPEHLSFFVQLLSNVSWGLPLMGLAYLINSDFHARASSRCLWVVSSGTVALMLISLDFFGEAGARQLSLVWISFVFIYVLSVTALRVWELGLRTNFQLVIGVCYAAVAGFVWSF